MCIRDSFGTTAKQLSPNAVFLRLYSYYNETKSRKTSHYTQFPLDHVGDAAGETPCSPWSYTLAAGQLPALVLARGIKLCKRGKLTKPSLTILNDIAGPHVHHVVSKEKTL